MADSMIRKYTYYYCSRCQQWFVTRLGAERHVVRVHPDKTLLVTLK